jgi:hypothetical protein
MLPLAFLLYKFVLMREGRGGRPKPRYHPSQTKSFAEKIIQVDENDDEIGELTKKEAHLLKNIEARNICHRAFSVFMFNSKNELLLQKRASVKITFKDMWTNSCCSHPMAVPGEREVKENRGKGLLTHIRHPPGGAKKDFIRAGPPAGGSIADEGHLEDLLPGEVLCRLGRVRD